MSRYIDADALLSKGHFVVRTNDFGERFVTVEEINKMPTVDAVQVVRCGRCEYYSNEMNCCSYVNGLQNVTKTDYCSYGRCADGERRTGMSLYNAIMGFNPACVGLLPMLGRKQDEYPRFRDCFLSDDGKRIVVYTRVGGGNRDCGYGEDELYKDENFVCTYDDDFDNTYGYYEFNVPSKWKKDFDAMMSNGTKAVSDEYVLYVKEFYPKLAETGAIDKFFGRANDEQIH